MRRNFRKFSVLLVMLLGSVASAGSVFLNGVNIDGVQNQKFEKATVRIDAQGNVMIDAPGYAARVVVQGGTPAAVSQVPGQIPSPGPPAVSPSSVPTPPSYPQPSSGTSVPRPPSGSGSSQPLAQITQRYYLVTEQTARGMTDYDVDVSVNGRWIRKLYSSEEQIITDITKFMAPGMNIVNLSAKKVRQGTRKSFSPEHVFRVIIGTGSVNGGANVTLDSPLVKFVRSAAEDRDITEEFTLTTR